MNLGKASDGGFYVLPLTRVNVRGRVLVLLIVAMLALASAQAELVSAAPAMSQVVSADPVDWTPHITDGAVWAMIVVGDTVVVGGDFTTVTNAHSSRPYERHYLMAFRLSDGAVTSFSPQLDGPVFALAGGPDGSVIAGGAFTTVNGHRRQSLVRLDVATGSVWDSFRPAVEGELRTLAVHGSSLYIGGQFTSIDGMAHAALARLAADTGQVDTGFEVKLAQAIGGQPWVESLAVSPDGTRLVAVGNFGTVQGQPRAQLVMLDVAGAGAFVAGWSTSNYQTRCHPQFNTYMRDVDFSPDGEYFVAVTTGHDSAPDLPCNTAARFEVDGAGDHLPTWVNHTGGHSLFSVAVTGSAVYVGGHQRWMDNPEGQKTKGPGAVDRPGIGAIDPATGRALAWNPTRSRGEGIRAFAVCPQGLLVGSDTDRLGHEHHARIGLFPSRTPTEVQPEQSTSFLSRTGD